MRKLTQEEFVRKAESVHGDKYDYSEVCYSGKDIKVKIICPEHGPFYQRPHNHLSGKQGCPKCKLKSQYKVFEKLKNHFPEEDLLFEVGKNIIPWIKRQRLDIYFPKHNIAVEYDGIQHFEIVPKYENGKEGLKLTQRRDRIKEKLCKQNNCILFRLKYDYTDVEFDELIKKITNICR